MQRQDDFPTPSSGSAASRHFHEMQFLDEFLSTSESNITNNTLLSTNSNIFKVSKKLLELINFIKKI